MRKRFDPVLVEVINNELSAITEEMAIVVWRSGQSAQLKTGDFATAVCDYKGRVIGQGFAAPFQLAVFEEMMSHIRARFPDGLAEGDVVITNDPFGGMGHLPDVGIVVPVFVDGQIAAYCTAYSHHTDVGGRFPGGVSSHPRSAYEEGLRIPLMKLVEGGVRNEQLLELIRSNVRVPREFEGDLEAKIAGCARGADQMAELIGKHGWESYLAVCDYVIEYAERSIRAAIGRAPDGRYTAECIVADDGVTETGSITLRVALTIAADELYVDFTGTSPQVPGALNAPMTMTKAGVYGALKCILGAELPTNYGFFQPIHIVAPPGCVLNPIYPAAVGGRAPIFFRIFDLIYAALAQALPGQVPVIGEGGDMLHFSGHSDEKGEYAFLDLYFGGWGGRRNLDGIDGVAPVFMGSYGCMSSELIEAQHPVVFEGFGLVPDSEGAGRSRGSFAIYRQWRFLAPGHAMIRSGRLGEAPGLEGGQAGRASRTLLISEGREIALPAKTHTHHDVRAGDRLYHATSGAGGYGVPTERAPDLVLSEWRAGLVSIENARERYGVIIEASGQLDEAATNSLRSRMAAMAV